MNDPKACRTSSVAMLRETLSEKILPELAELERALARLEESDALQDVLEHTSDPVFIIDPQMLRWANSSAAQQIGRSNVALARLPLSEIFRSVSPEKDEFTRLSAHVGRGPVLVEFITVTGAILPLSGRVFELGPDTLAILARRSTVRSAMSEAAIDLEDMVRAPLVGMLGMVELLAATEMDAQQQELLDMVVGSGRALVEVFESSGCAGTLETFDLFGFLDEISRVYSKFALRKHLDFDLVVDPMISRTWIADVSGLRQVLSNLLNNAIKYTLEGQVQLTVVTLDDGRLRFVVDDSGPGMSDEIRELLTRCFQERHEGARPHPLGVGMGLSRSKRLVTAMRGEMGVESTIGRGSRFWFTVALQAAPQEAHEAGSDERSLRILCAEDNPIHRQVLRRMLETLGHRVVLVENGWEVLDYPKVGEFDLILMDCQMPLMDGYEAARSLRARGWTAVPIVALTGTSSGIERSRCLESGMTEYLRKPVSLEGLGAALRRIVPPLRRTA